MNKGLLVWIWVLGCVLPLAAQEHIRLISDIGLIDNDTSQRTAPPNTLVVGIEVNRDVLYKLSDDSGIIQGGQFLRGFNSFELDVRHRFDRSGTYAYTLELKAGTAVVQREFKIDIRLDLPENLDEDRVEAPPESEHVVSLYVGGQLVVSYRKLHTAPLSKEIAAIPRPYQINPYDSSAEPSPDTGVPILGAAAAALQVIKGLLSKKGSDKPSRPVVKKTQIAKRFFRVNSSGEEQPVTAVISLWIDNNF